MVNNLNRIALLLLLAVVTGSLQAASLEAQIDRSVVNMGETLVLELIQRDGDSEPDISILQADFDVLSTARNSQVSIVNGAMDSYVTWRYTLSPLRSGTLIIPAISAGTARSKPIGIKVNPANTTANGAAKQAVFLEAEVDNMRPYVQSQVIYTVRIFRARDFYDGSLSDPKSDDYIHQRLGEDTNYNVQRNGVRYKVIERRYVLFPQRSGEVAVPPIVLSATVATGAGSQGTFGGFSARGRAIRLRSEPITLDVKPAASAFSGSWWLPAKSLQLTESWSDSVDNLRVGSPVTRTINIEAQGVLRGQIPTLSMPDINGLKVYSDQPELAENVTAEGLIGQHTERWAIIPSQAGHYVLPEVRIAWWDVSSDQEKIAVLPEKTIEVLPAVSAIQPPVDSESPSAPLERVAKSDLTTDERSVIDAAQGNNSIGVWPQWIWPVVVTLLLLGWALTTGLLLYKLRNRSVVNDNLIESAPLPHVPLKQLKAVCAAGDLPAIKHVVLKWAAATWPTRPPLSLVEVSVKLSDKRLTSILLAVDAAIYSGKQVDAIKGLDGFADALVHRQKRLSTKTPQQDNPLPVF